MDWLNTVVYTIVSGALAGLVALCILYAAVAVSRRRRRSAEVIPPPPPLEPRRALDIRTAELLMKFRDSRLSCEEAEELSKALEERLRESEAVGDLHRAFLELTLLLMLLPLRAECRVEKEAGQRKD